MQSPGTSNSPAAGTGKRSACTSIAVVMSNYNHAHYLPEAIESVIAQSVPPREFVIVDDCSTDNSVDVIERYARNHRWIRLIRCEKNQGGIRNVNAVLATLQSTHFISLAADDRLRPGFFEVATHLLEQHPEAGLCLCDFEVFWNDGRTNERRMGLARDECYFPPATVPRILCNTWPHGQSIVRVSALRQAGGYREDLRWHCDWFASWAICVRSGFCYTPTIGASLRISESSYSGAGRRGAQQREVLRRIIELLTAPGNEWLREPLREANALSHFGTVVIGVILGAPAARGLLTPRLVGAIVRQSIYQSASRVAPRALKDWLKRNLWQQR